MLKGKILKRLYYNKKLSMWDIAKVLSVTPATVEYWMNKRNLPTRGVASGVHTSLHMVYGVKR